MPSARMDRDRSAGAWGWLVFGLLALAPALASVPARAESAAGAELESRRPFPQRESSGRHRAASPEGTGGWWLGTAGIALALALCGGISVVSKRYLPNRGGTGPLRVIGRASLSPKQAVYLVEVGERILILGGGGQGPPSLLGELTDPTERRRFAGPGPRRPSPSVSSPVEPGRFDQRVGDDE